VEQHNEFFAYGSPTGISNTLITGADKNRRKHTGKEFISELGVDSYDFSARFLAPLTGRFDSPDPKAWDYTWLSPYTFCAADPINNSDPTGKVIFFVNGYTGFVKSGKPYWTDKNPAFVEGAKKYFNDTKIEFIAIDHSLNSSANKRYNNGYQYAKENITALTENLQNGETLKFVAHSMGCAFTEGVVEYLIEQGVAVSEVVHINAFQARGILASDYFLEPTVKTTDYQNTDDKVINYLPFANPGDIRNADYKIREHSNSNSKDPKASHSAVIDLISDFWETLHDKQLNSKK
jgi:RHS repeat-associated protein